MDAYRTIPGAVRGTSQQHVYKETGFIWKETSQIMHDVQNFKYYLAV